MDPLCHTLVGAALGRAGLRSQSGLAGAALLIGANLPDIDVLALPLDRGLEWRRGWTHGLVAVVVLPLLLTFALAGWARVRDSGGPPVRFGALLVVCMIGVGSHPLLDYLNVYGVRLLMPIEGRWFYGDTLFIADPWILLILGAGVLLARRRVAIGSTAPARVALTLVLFYVLGMGALTGAARRAVAAELSAASPHAKGFMVAPVPVTPWIRNVIVAEPGAYRTGRIAWTPRPRVILNSAEIPRDQDSARARRAAATPEGERFLGWSRMPYYRVEAIGDDGSVRVRIADLRYAMPGEASWASVVVSLPADARRDD